MSTLTNTVSGSVATASFAERMETLKQLASMTGIRLPATIIPEGESLIPYGVERQRALQDEIAALPSVQDAAELLRAVRTEQRPIDTAITINDLRMRPADAGLHGRNCDPNKRALGYTPVAFAQAAQFMKPSSVTGGFAPTLLALPPVIYAAVHWAALGRWEHVWSLVLLLAAPLLLVAAAGESLLWWARLTANNPRSAAVLRVVRFAAAALGLAGGLAAMGAPTPPPPPPASRSLSPSSRA